MSLMGGLVETGVEHATVAPAPASLGDWMVRNAWRVVVGFSAVFWLIVVAAIIFG